MKIFLHILTQNIVPIFMLIGLGILLGKKFKLDVKTLSKLTFYALMPIFTFVTIYTNDLSVNMSKTILFALLFLILNTAAAYTASAISGMKRSKRYILVNAVILYNSGNIGIPLISLIFAGTPFLNQALLIQITIMLTQSLLGSTIGFYNAGRGEMNWKMSLISVLRMPAIYAILAAAVLKQFDFDLTMSFIWPAFDYMKQAMIGLALLTLGVQLSYTKAAAGDADVIIAVLLRLVGGPLGALLIIKLLGFSGILAQVLFISSASPTAVTSALIAVERNSEPDFAAKAVMYATIFCSVTLIFTVYFSKILFPFS